MGVRGIATKPRTVEVFKEAACRIIHLLLPLGGEADIPLTLWQ